MSVTDRQTTDGRATASSLKSGAKKNYIKVQDFNADISQSADNEGRE